MVDGVFVYRQYPLDFAKVADGLIQRHVGRLLYGKAVERFIVVDDFSSSLFESFS